MFVELGDHKVALDSSESSADIKFVSHAHTDHISGVRNNDAILASKATAELLQARGKQNVSVIEIPNNVKLLDAGHIHGSKQIFIEDYEKGYSLLYTGDYQLDEPIIAEKIQVHNADILIIDSTYPYENLVFDSKSEVITAIQHYIKNKLKYGNVIFKAYQLGRTQELIRVINDIGIVPVVGESTRAINEVYNSHGLHLAYEVYNYTNTENDTFVGIFGSKEFAAVTASLSSKRARFFTAVATGWAKLFRFNTSVQFALTDHADLKQAIEYINMCNPKTILTVGRNARLLALKLSRLGYDAKEASRQIRFETEHVQALLKTNNK